MQSATLKRISKAGAIYDKIEWLAVERIKNFKGLQERLVKKKAIQLSHGQIANNKLILESRKKEKL